MLHEQLYCNWLHRNIKNLTTLSIENGRMHYVAERSILLEQLYRKWVNCNVNT